MKKCEFYGYFSAIRALFLFKSVSNPHLYSFMIFIFLLIKANSIAHYLKICYYMYNK